MADSMAAPRVITNGTFAIWTNTSRAYEEKSSELIQPDPRSRACTVHTQGRIIGLGDSGTTTTAVPGVLCQPLLFEPTMHCTILAEGKLTLWGISEFDSNKSRCVAYLIVQCGHVARRLGSCCCYSVSYTFLELRLKNVERNLTTSPEPTARFFSCN